MAGEDQERFEDYLELEHFIEELQAGRVAHPPKDLTPEQARIYGMATLFHAASNEEATPRPEFVAELGAKLEQETQPRTKTLPFTSKKPRRRPRVSRRELLTGGVAAAAASFAIGAGIDHGIEEQKLSAATNRPWGSILSSNSPTIWFPAAHVSQLGDSPIRFTSDALSGYVIRDTGDAGDPADPDKGKIIAMSAHCTDMGCIVQWQKGARKYECPCHGVLFSEYGQVDAASAPNLLLLALPRLETKIDPDGTILVRVPAVSKA